MKSRKPIKRSRRCPRGIRKSDGRCKRKPGPKRSRKMKKSRKPKQKSRKLKQKYRAKFKMTSAEYVPKFYQFFKYITSNILYDVNNPIISNDITNVRNIVKDLFNIQNTRATKLSYGNFSSIYQKHLSLII